MATTQLFTAAIRNNKINNFTTNPPSKNLEVVKLGVITKRVGSSLSDSNDQFVESLKKSSNSLVVPNNEIAQQQKKKSDSYRKSATNLFESISNRGSLEKIKEKYLSRNHHLNHLSSTPLNDDNGRKYPTTSIYSAMSPSTSTNFQTINESKTRPIILIYEIHRNGFRIANLESSLSTELNEEVMPEKSPRVKPLLTKFSAGDEPPIRRKRLERQQDRASALLAFSKSFKKIKRARTVCSEATRRCKKRKSIHRTNLFKKKNRSQSTPCLRPSICELFYLYLKDFNTATVKIEKEFLRSYDHSKQCICDSASTKNKPNEGVLTNLLLNVDENSKNKRSLSLIPYTSEQKQQINCPNRKELLKNYNKVKLSELYRKKQYDNDKVFKNILNLNNFRALFWIAKVLIMDVPFINL